MSTFSRIAAVVVFLFSVGLLVSALPSPRGDDSWSIVGADTIPMCGVLAKFFIEVKACLEAITLCQDIVAVKLQIVALVGLLKGCTADLVKIGADVKIATEVQASIVTCFVSFLTLLVKVCVDLTAKFGLKVIVALCVEVDTCLHALLVQLNVCIHGVLALIVKGCAESVVGITRRESHVLLEDAEAVCNRYNQLRKYGDRVLFGAWVEHRKRRTNNRRKHALELIKFLDALEQEQIHERDNLKAARRADIETRFLKQGWTRDDMDFTTNYQWKKQWLALVEQPKQLNERVWTNLTPDEGTCRTPEGLQDLLETVLIRDRAQYPPLLKFEFQKSTGSQQNYNFRDIFPDVEDVLEWPLIQTMNDNDLGVTAFRQKLLEHKDDISNLLTQWREKIRTHMVTLLRTENRTYNPILEPPESSTSDPFIDLSDDFKLLLRADSLFYLARTFSGIRLPFVYHETVEAGHDAYCCDRQGLWVGGKKDPLDMDRFRRYSNAQKVARVLLRSIGKPNASFLELEMEDYVCGRCHDIKPRSWGEIVQHYVEQKRTFMRIQESAPKLAKKGITYNNVHDAEFDEDQPLIRILEPRISDKKVVPLRECNLCIKKPIALELVASENKLLRHLLEVHDIAEPELGVDYDISGRSTFGLEAGFGHDFRDADDNESDSESGDEEESDSDYDGEGQRWVSSFWFVHNGRWVKPGS
ncbi:Major DNA-binding protein [Rhizoctonia solani]|uniref:Major DNA-binding protein n=1 Tax=Rhizoctonia solani TaxID=456999 RepID=A0A0K6G9S1_9AGAM|nr:Major DNA-binding protein [Rhizoctonia solani]